MYMSCMQLTVVEFHRSVLNLEAAHVIAVIAVVGFKRHKQDVAAGKYGTRQYATSKVAQSW